jgi:hypothetical protein
MIRCRQCRHCPQGAPLEFNIDSSPVKVSKLETRIRRILHLKPRPGDHWRGVCKKGIDIYLFWYTSVMGTELQKYSSILRTVSVGECPHLELPKPSTRFERILRDDDAL